ncbi:MAG: serine/threonine protein kinase, partial [Planctomycetes bacterium]|nr:serine/threonine protein kinase [Planctomycetota bacterium]
MTEDDAESEPMGAEPSLDGAARFRYLEHAFAEVADAASGVQRAKVAELRQLDAALGEQLAQLLTAAGSEKAGQMDVPQFDPELVPTPSKPESRLGQNVGPFQLDAVLGSGGMGEVYLASRRDDFAQTVAIKLLRGAMSDGIFAQRFLQERETLGRLNHPHIAGLIDGGATKEGSPWLAMEHVAGVNLVDYCNQEKLSAQGTIKLLLEVAEAVQFAHQQLIVHRDIKPGNIMV